MLTSERREKKQGKIRNSEYYGMESIFDTLYAESRNGKTFNHLMAIIESEENIKLAYRTIKRNHGSKTPGVDKKTIRNLAKLSEDEYVRLVKKKFSNYHPRPVRREEIPKDNGKTRPLGIPAISDRIVQQCILQVCKLYCKPCATEFDGTPCAVKAARTVWSRGKVGDYIEDLPMAIGSQKPGYETAYGGRRYRPGRRNPDPAAGRPVRLRADLWAVCLKG